LSANFIGEQHFVWTTFCEYAALSMDTRSYADGVKWRNKLSDGEL